MVFSSMKGLTASAERAEPDGRENNPESSAEVYPTPTGA